jgi:hypothetical protein
MPEWIYSVIAVIIITVLVSLFVHKRKGEEWKGELVKKKYNSGDEDTTETFTLVFKREDGKKRRFQVHRQIFDSWVEGDKAEKVKGEFSPKKI